MEVWKHLEKRRNRRPGRHRVRGSGCGPLNKGDSQSRSVLEECKHTSKDYITLQKGWFEKILDQALAVGKVPTLAIGFGPRENMSIFVFWWIGPAAPSRPWLGSTLKIRKSRRISLSQLTANNWTYLRDEGFSDDNPGIGWWHICSESEYGQEVDENEY